jgi:hypothetical protein
MIEKPKPNIAIVVPGGNPVHLAGTWIHRLSGEPTAPTEVRWQVFDGETLDAIGSQQVVDAELLDSTMQFSIPGSALPGPEAPGALTDRRRLLVKVGATFGPGQTRTEYVDVYVQREVPWA